MSRKKNLVILIIISIVFLFISGCNLVISMIEPNSPPVAISCRDYEVYVNEWADLDGNDSYDPDGDVLTYTWSIQSKPGDSRLENADIRNRNTESASVLLDRAGKYEFKLTVSDGNNDSHDILMITGIPEPEPEPTPTPTPEPTPNASPPYGLMLEYLCNGNANDTSEYENHGTVYGAQLFPDRENSSNKAYYFNSSNEYIDCGNGYSLNTYPELTIALWMRPNHLDCGVILSKRENLETGYELRLASGAISFSEGENILAASVLGEEKLGEWFHVAVTWKPFDSDNEPCCIYINGTVALVTGIELEDFQYSSAHLFIGKSDFRRENYNGAVDDVRMYDRVLSSEEIIDIMNLVQ